MRSDGSGSRSPGIANRNRHDLSTAGGSSPSIARSGHGQDLVRLGGPQTHRASMAHHVPGTAPRDGQEARGGVVPGLQAVG
jgi:hypothetical protein